MLSASVTGQEMTFKTACPDKILPDSKGWNGRQRLCSQLRETAEGKVPETNRLSSQAIDIIRIVLGLTSSPIGEPRRVSESSPPAKEVFVSQSARVAAPP